MNKPIFSLERFPVQVAVWENVKDDRTYYSTKMTKRYKDEDTGEYKNTEYLSPADLLIAAELLREVWRRVAVKERKPSQETTEVKTADEDTPF